MGKQIVVGSTVLITAGEYRSIKGVVTSLEGYGQNVKVKLNNTDFSIHVYVPISFLQVQ